MAQGWANGKTGVSAMGTELFVGIDVSKDKFDLATTASCQQMQFANDKRGISALVKWLDGQQPTLVVLEASGGYERALVSALGAAGSPVAVINPRKARDFARAGGKLAKTDAIDAAMLADFAQTMRPQPRPVPDEQALQLKALAAYRRDLLEDIVRYSNRLETALPSIARRIRKRLGSLKKELAGLEKEIEDTIRSNPLWREKVALLQSAPGVGPVISFALIAELPELGEAEHKPIAALVGVAPFNCDSGRHKGKRVCRGGRCDLRRSLYMGTLSATRYNAPIRDFYQSLLARGKPKQLAIIACMRKLLTHLNAMMRDNRPWQNLTCQP
jgi:transposase